MTELLRELKDGNVSPKDSPLSPATLSELLGLVKDQTSSIKIAKEIFLNYAGPVFHQSSW